MIHYMTPQGVWAPWVGNELRVVAREGIPFVLHSLISPANAFFSSADVGEIHRRTRVVYPVPILAGAWSFMAAPARFRRFFAEALWNALTGKRESLRVRGAGLWHFFVACHWAGQLRSENVKLIHSQWIHSAGTVAMYGAWVLNVPFSFTGHAADLFRERAALSDKIRRARFIICISTFHRDFFLKEGARPEQLRIAYCGIDPLLFSPKQREGKTGDRFRILASGRLVEKKGFSYLIRACRILRDRGVDCLCTIAGNGELEHELRALTQAMGLADSVEITGRPLKQEDIPAFMHQGDAYCLPCVWASDGDVDGLPQMLMEAMACGLPAVSTRLVGIPDLIIHGRTGLLVEPNQAEQLADALQRLRDEPDLAELLARQGRDHVLERFNLASSLQPLLNEFRALLESE